MGRVQGKVAIVTGAASPIGIGFATAQALMREGAKVVLTDIDGDRVKARAIELGGSAYGIAHDVTKEDDWSRVVTETVARHGGVDILVNNAGVAFLGPIGEFTKANWDKQIEINLSSMFLGCKAVLKIFRLRGRGTIVNTSSVAGVVGVPGGAVYSASKAGVALFTKSLAVELARENIRVN
jgi:NAD(P)-dependent dehydrogenase (short-subunit alcohol dehydrogenase family)